MTAPSPSPDSENFRPVPPASAAAGSTAEGRPLTGEPAAPYGHGEPTGDELPEPPAKPPLPPSVIGLGAVAVILLVVVIALSARNGKGSGSDAESRALKAQIDEMKRSNEQLKLGMGLSEVGPNGESAEKIASRLREDIGSLTAFTTKAGELIGAKDTELLNTRKLLSDAQQAQKALSDQMLAMRQELNGVNRQNVNASGLEAQLQSAVQRISDLTEQVQQLQLAPVDLQKKLTDVTVQRDALEREVRELRARLAKINIFAGSESDIQQEAQALYHNLRSLEGQPQSEIARAYSQYNAALGADRLNMISFATGSSDLSADDMDKLRGQVAASPDNAFFFVVGYASKTGSVDDNRKLSSARATAVASALADLKKPNQKVQAAYMGQTDRFGPPEANQVCELWQVVAK